MVKTTLPEAEKVFGYFEEISAIPRGSKNSDAIASYCVDFAKAHGLEFIRDNADNVIIFKPGTEGYENSDPVILQGHLDMVCQKDEDCDIDFLKDGLRLFYDGDFLKARGTTLGADDGIAVAFILAILDSNSLPHPPIEAVFTTDEEIGMLGACALDTSVLKGRRMINIDSEEDDVLTVSCAGGSDFHIQIPLTRKEVFGTEVSITLKGLTGGHSGVEINSGRVNADILAGRLLNRLSDFELLKIDGGDKGNAIPRSCKIRLCAKNANYFAEEAQEYLSEIKEEISAREPDFSFDISKGDDGKFSAFDDSAKDCLIYLLVCAPNGVMQMSAEIDGLVETSLNLGIVKTEDDAVSLLFTLRSNKSSALEFLEERLKLLSSVIPCTVNASGHYPPWEFKRDSPLQKLYRESFAEHFNKQVKVEAIHAGLECGIFSSKIEGLDCISIGPKISDIHTVSERLSVSSAKAIFGLLADLLKKCK